MTPGAKRVWIITSNIRPSITSAGRPARRSEALQPDQVGQQNVVEGAVDGAKERTAVRFALVIREGARCRVDLVVHPGVVAGHAAIGAEGKG